MNKRLGQLKTMAVTVWPAIVAFYRVATSRTILLTLSALLPLAAWFYHLSAVASLISLRIDFAWGLLIVFLFLAWLPIYYGERRFQSSGQNSETILVAAAWVLAAAFSWFWALRWWSVDWPAWWCLVWLAAAACFSFLGFKVFIGWSEIWRRLWLPLVAKTVHQNITGKHSTFRPGRFLSPNRLRIARAVHDQTRLQLYQNLGKKDSKATPHDLGRAQAEIYACHDNRTRWSFAREADRDELRHWLCAELALDEVVLMVGRFSTCPAPVWLSILLSEPRPHTLWTAAVTSLADAHVLSWDDWLRGSLTPSAALGAAKELRVPHASSPGALYAQAWLSLMPAVAERCHIPEEEQLDAWLEIARLTGQPPGIAATIPGVFGEGALRGRQATYCSLAAHALESARKRHRGDAVGEETRKLFIRDFPKSSGFDHPPELPDEVWEQGLKEARDIDSWPYEEVWAASRSLAAICVAVVTGLTFMFLLCTNPSLPLSLGWNTVDTLENRDLPSVMAPWFAEGAKTARAGAVSGRQMAEATDTNLVVHDIPTRVNLGATLKKPALDIAAHPMVDGFVAIDEDNALQVIDSSLAVSPYLAPKDGCLWNNAEPGPILASGMKSAVGETGGESRPKDFLTLVVRGAGVANYELPDRARGRFFGTWRIGSPHKPTDGWVGDTVVFTYDGKKLRGFDRSTLTERGDFTSTDSQVLDEGVQRFESGRPGTTWAAAISKAGTLLFADGTTKGWRGPFFSTFSSSFTIESVTSLRVKDQVLWMNSKPGLVAYDMRARSLLKPMTGPLCLLETVPGGVLAAGASLELFETPETYKTLWRGQVSRAAVSPASGPKAAGGSGIVFEAGDREEKPLMYLDDPVRPPVQIHAGADAGPKMSVTRITGVVPLSGDGMLIGSDIAPFVYHMDQHAYRVTARGQFTSLGANNVPQSSSQEAMVSNLSVLVGGNHGIVGMRGGMPLRFDEKSSSWTTLDPTQTEVVAIIPPMKKDALYWGLTKTSLCSYTGSGLDQPRMYCQKETSLSLNASAGRDNGFYGDALDHSRPDAGFVFAAGDDIVTYHPSTGVLESDKIRPPGVAATVELRVLDGGAKRVWRSQTGGIFVRNTRDPKEQNPLDFGSPGVGEVSKREPRLTALATPPGKPDSPHVLIDGNGGGFYHYDWKRGYWKRLDGDAILPSGRVDFSVPLQDVGLIHDSMNRVWTCLPGKGWQCWANVTKAAAHGDHLFGLTADRLLSAPLNASQLGDADATYCHRADMRGAFSSASFVWQPDKNTLAVLAPDGREILYDHATANTHATILQGVSGPLQFSTHGGRLLAVGLNRAWWFEKTEGGPMRQEPLALIDGGSEHAHSTCAVQGDTAQAAVLGRNGDVTVYEFHSQQGTASIGRGQGAARVPLGDTVLAWREPDQAPLFIVTRDGHVLSYQPENGSLRLLRNARSAERLEGWRESVDEKPGGFELLFSTGAQCSIVRIAHGSVRTPWPSFDTDSASLVEFLTRKDKDVRTRLAAKTSERNRLQGLQQEAGADKAKDEQNLDRLLKAKETDPSDLAKAKRELVRQTAALAEAETRTRRAQEELGELEREASQLHLQKAPFFTQPWLLDADGVQVTVQNHQLTLSLSATGGRVVLHSGQVGFREDNLTQIEYAGDGTLWALDDEGNVLKLVRGMVNGNKALLPLHHRHSPLPPRLERSTDGAVRAVVSGTDPISLSPPKESRATLPGLTLDSIHLDIQGTSGTTGYIISDTNLFDQDGSFAWQAVSDLACDGDDLFLSTPMGLIRRHATTFEVISVQPERRGCRLASAPGLVLARTPARANPDTVKGVGTELNHKASTGPWRWSQRRPPPWSNGAGMEAEVHCVSEADSHDRQWTPCGSRWVWKDDFATGLLARQLDGLMFATKDGVWHLGADGRDPNHPALLPGMQISATAELSSSEALWRDSEQRWHPLLPVPSSGSARVAPGDEDLSPHAALRVTLRQGRLLFAAFDGGEVFSDGRFFTDAFDQLGMDEQGCLYTLHTPSGIRCLMQRRYADRPGLVTAAWSASSLGALPSTHHSAFLDMVNNGLWLRLDKSDGERQVFRLGQSGPVQELRMAEAAALQIQTGPITWRLKHGEASHWEPCISQPQANTLAPLSPLWSQGRFSWDRCTSFAFLDEHTFAWQSPAGLVLTRLEAGKNASPILSITPRLEGACTVSRELETGRILGLCIGERVARLETKTSEITVEASRQEPLECFAHFAPEADNGPIRVMARWHQQKADGGAELLALAIPGIQRRLEFTGGRFPWDQCQAACGDGTGLCATLDSDSIFNNHLADDGLDLMAAGHLPTAMAHVKTSGGTLFVADAKGEALHQGDLQCQHWGPAPKDSERLFIDHEKTRLDAINMTWKGLAFHAWEGSSGPELQLDPPTANAILTPFQSTQKKGIKWSFDRADSLAFLKDSRQVQWLALHTYAGIWACPWQAEADKAFQNVNARMTFAINGQNSVVSSAGRIRPLRPEIGLNLQQADGGTYFWMPGETYVNPSKASPVTVGPWSMREGRLWNQGSPTVRTNDFLFPRKDLNDVIELLDAKDYGTWLLCRDRRWVKLVR